VGVLGTINYRYYNLQGELIRIPSSFTTPEPMLLQQTLREMCDNGVDTVIMEVSSHGLEQNRIGNLVFEVAAFTNLSRDHLDYHGNMEDYFSVKTLLFTKHLSITGTAVITFRPEDSTWSARLKTLCLDKGFSVLSCGQPGDSDIFPMAVAGDLKETKINLHTPYGECTVVSSLVGIFNVENIQTCFGMALALGLPISDISTYLNQAPGAPGRLQRIKLNKIEQSFRPTVFVDFAHTPDALKQVLKTIKALPHSNLYCVFGCGGDRDSGKRQVMGEVAGRYSDVVILTDDNPRTEDSTTILKAIVEGISQTALLQHEQSWLNEKKAEEKGFVVLADRHKAIAAAITAAGGNDIVLIAGKGHENYQLTSRGKRFFDDSLEAEGVLSGWKIESLVNATRGQLVGVESSKKVFPSIKTDSRTIQKDDVFVALIGERFDAHDYVSQVVSSDAGCLILERMPENPLTIPVILVNNTEQALGDLASYRRLCIKEISNPRVVSITGSSGKTTVKEMCAAIFNEQWPEGTDTPPNRVLKTEGNFNNLIGLPLSLLPLSPKHKAVILEMGMNVPGEIKRLAEIADPDIACILNVHGAHLLGLGSIEGVAKAKEELFQACDNDTVLVINSDDPRVMDLSRKYEQKKIFFALNNDSTGSINVYSSDIKSGDLEEQYFYLHVAEQHVPVHLHVPGHHNVLNGLAAAAIAHAAGIDITLIAKGLSSFEPTDRRMEVLEGPAASRIINDTYNANPESMRAGLNTLSALGSGRRFAILGDMLELGVDSEALHTATGAHVAESGIDFLGIVGDFASFTADGAIRKGMDTNSVHVFSGQDDCYDWLIEMLAGDSIEKGAYVLVKCSRGMHLDKLVERLIQA
jgi:murE/murF fusion protein